MYIIHTFQDIENKSHHTTSEKHFINKSSEATNIVLNCMLINT